MSTKNKKEREQDEKSAPGMRVLPVIAGYTVDERLREFRKLDYAHGIFEIVPFASPKGQRLLARWVVAQSRWARNQ